MIMRTSIVAAAAAAVFAAPALAQQAPAPGEDAAGAGVLADPLEPLPRSDQPAPWLYGKEIEGYAAEDFYWMNPEADRWPDDLDPRDNVYLPSPEPALRFELDLDL